MKLLHHWQKGLKGTHCKVSSVVFWGCEDARRTGRKVDSESGTYSNLLLFLSSPICVNLKTSIDVTGCIRGRKLTSVLHLRTAASLAGFIASHIPLHFTCSLPSSNGAEQRDSYMLSHLTYRAVSQKTRVFTLHLRDLTSIIQCGRVTSLVLTSALIWGARASLGHGSSGRMIDMMSDELLGCNTRHQHCRTYHPRVKEGTGGVFSNKDKKAVFRTCPIRLAVNCCLVQ